MVSRKSFKISGIKETQFLELGHKQETIPNANRLMLEQESVESFDLSVCEFLLPLYVEGSFLSFLEVFVSDTEVRKNLNFHIIDSVEGWTYVLRRTFWFSQFTLLGYYI